MLTDQVALGEVHWRKPSLVQFIEVSRDVEDGDLNDETSVVNGFEDERAMVVRMNGVNVDLTPSFLSPD